MSGILHTNRPLNTAPAVYSGYGPIPHHKNGLNQGYDGDVILSYSDFPGPSVSATESYISAFIEENFDDETVGTILQAFPILLKSLASIVDSSPSQIYRKIMVFVYKHRDTIATSFKERSWKGDSNPVKGGLLSNPELEEIAYDSGLGSSLSPSSNRSASNPTSDIISPSTPPSSSKVLGKQCQRS
ncbi:hypothetical protein F4814DRAFT_459498 [Daldinia grandis]|nr:hypothetical protein F4814DRAFT_459498 [Daldinia grandis]